MTLYVPMQLGEKAQQEAIELDEAKSKHETKLKVQDDYTRSTSMISICCCYVNV